MKDLERVKYGWDYIFKVSKERQLMIPIIDFPCLDLCWQRSEEEDDIELHHR